MIKQILTATFFAISMLSYSQDNLEFNQIIQGELSGTVSGPTIVGTITVPAGKVWKLETRSVVRTNYATVNVGRTSATIGGLLVYWDEYPTQSPVWLSEGTYDVSIDVSNGGIPYIFSYNGIEYNLEP
jgi:hypothetical protein